MRGKIVYKVTKSPPPHQITTENEPRREDGPGNELVWDEKKAEYRFMLLQEREERGQLKRAGPPKKDITGSDPLQSKKKKSSQTGKRKFEQNRAQYPEDENL